MQSIERTLSGDKNDGANVDCTSDLSHMNHGAIFHDVKNNFRCTLLNVFLTNVQFIALKPASTVALCLSPSDIFYKYMRKLQVLKAADDY